MTYYILSPVQSVGIRETDLFVNLKHTGFTLTPLIQTIRRDHPEINHDIVLATLENFGSAVVEGNLYISSESRPISARGNIVRQACYHTLYKDGITRSSPISMATIENFLPNEWKGYDLLGYVDLIDPKYGHLKNLKVRYDV